MDEIDKRRLSAVKEDARVCVERIPPHMGDFQPRVMEFRDCAGEQPQTIVEAIFLAVLYKLIMLAVDIIQAVVDPRLQLRLR